MMARRCMLEELEKEYSLASDGRSVVSNRACQ